MLSYEDLAYLVQTISSSLRKPQTATIADDMKYSWKESLSYRWFTLVRDETEMSKPK